MFPPSSLKGPPAGNETFALTRQMNSSLDIWNKILNIFLIIENFPTNELGILMLLKIADKNYISKTYKQQSRFSSPKVVDSSICGIYLGLRS